MFADPDVANFSQKIGLISLGASDSQVIQLGALYFQIIEFGVCKEGSKKLGYGAGIAGCIEEMENLLSDKAKFKKFEPSKDCFDTDLIVRTVQPLYRVTEDFDDALRDL